MEKIYDLLKLKKTKIIHKNKINEIIENKETNNTFKRMKSISISSFRNEKNLKENNKSKRKSLKIIKKKKKRMSLINNLITISNIDDNNFSGNDIKKFELCKKIMAYNDYEMNDLPYINALKSDKRTYCQYYISLIKMNHLFLFSFVHKGDYNSRILKIFLFLFIIIINFTLNALFFDDSTMHLIYESRGKFNFIYQLPQTIYSAIISGILSAIFRTLSLTEKSILLIKKENDLKVLEQKSQDIL